MRIYVLLAGAMGLALAGTAAAQAQEKSWGSKTTTYWSSDSTGKYEPGQFMTPSTPQAQPTAMQQDMRAPARTTQRMFYQAPGKGKVVRAKMRPRQQQPGMTPGTGAQPPDVKPSAPPARGQQPMGDQPTQGQPPQGQPPQGQPPQGQPK